MAAETGCATAKTGTAANVVPATMRLATDGKDRIENFIKFFLKENAATLAVLKKSAALFTALSAHPIENANANYLHQILLPFRKLKFINGSKPMSRADVFAAWRSKRPRR